MESKGLEDVKVNDVLELRLALFPGSAHSPLSFFPPQNEESTAKEVVKAIETAESDYQVGGGWWMMGGGWWVVDGGMVDVGWWMLGGGWWDGGWWVVGGGGWWVVDGGWWVVGGG